MMFQKTNINYIFKVILVGNGGVGKTSFLNRLIFNKFDINCQLTIGVDILSYRCRIDDSRVHAQFWDFGGQDRFRSFQAKFVLGASGIILMFDLTSYKTLMDSLFWYNFVEEYINCNHLFILMGNKSDLIRDKAIQQKEINELKKKPNIIKYIETSALDNKNIESSTLYLFEQLIKSKDT